MELVRKPLLSRVFFWLAIFVVMVYFMTPIIWLVSTSFKNFIDAFALPPKIIFKPTMENYARVLGNADFLRYMLNSIVIAASSTAICLLLGVPAAYAVGIFEFKRKNDFSFLVLSLRIAPPIMSLLPMYIIFSNLSLIRTKVPLIFMYTLMNLPLAIWILPVYFRDIPRELYEAAIIDGCGEFFAFARIMLPLARGGIAATTILCFMNAWNEFLYALVLSGGPNQTLPVAVTSFMTFQGTQWGSMSAAGTIIMLPMLVFATFVQKYFAKGMTLGAVKG